jgi:vacuolar-type H+-ATPase subunit H
MSLTSVVLAAIFRKFSAIVTELRYLVAEAKSAADKIFNNAKVEAAVVLAEAEVREANILSNAKAEAKKLENELIDKIAKL